MDWRRLRHLGEYAAFRLVVCLCDALPWRTSIRVAEGLAWTFTYVLPRKLTRYHVARENLRRAFGEHMSEARVERLVYGMWRHLFRMVVEIVQLPRKVTLYNCAHVMRWRYRDEMTRTLASGRPVIVVSGHFGNWESANRAMGLFGFPMGTVARDMDNPYLHRWFERFRREFGHYQISKSGGGQEIVEVLERRGIVGLLCDQDAGPKGLFVDFFGAPASTFKSIAMLALQFEAPICVACARRLPDDFEAHRWVVFENGCEAIIDPRDHQDDPDALRQITQRYTEALERAIRRSPEQYFWVHRRWKSEPRKRGRSAKAQKAA